MTDAHCTAKLSRSFFISSSRAYIKDFPSMINASGASSRWSNSIWCRPPVICCLILSLDIWKENHHSQQQIRFVVINRAWNCKINAFWYQLFTRNIMDWHEYLLYHAIRSSTWNADKRCLNFASWTSNWDWWMTIAWIETRHRSYEQLPTLAICALSPNSSAAITSGISKLTMICLIPWRNKLHANLHKITTEK